MNNYHQINIKQIVKLKKHEIVNENVKPSKMYITDQPIIEKKVSSQKCIYNITGNRFCATGTFQYVAVGELIGVHQSTVSRTIARVTDALVARLHIEIKMPQSRYDADITKVKFFASTALPNCIGCIDGTHVKIQAPTEEEHEFVNHKGYHSINVQVSRGLCSIENRRIIKKKKSYRMGILCWK